MAHQPTLRLYVSVWKILLLMLLEVGIELLCWIALQSSEAHGSTGDIVIAYLALTFFGAAVILFSVILVRTALLRRPFLRIDSQGWTYCPPLGFGKRFIPWEEIRGIEIYRQVVPYSIGYNYYLVLQARHPDTLPRTRWRALTSFFYPSAASAKLSMPLMFTFVRLTRANTAQLVRDIRSTFSHEIHLHQIAVSDKALMM